MSEWEFIKFKPHKLSSTFVSFQGPEGRPGLPGIPAVWKTLYKENLFGLYINLFIFKRSELFCFAGRFWKRWS